MTSVGKASVSKERIDPSSETSGSTKTRLVRTITSLSKFKRKSQKSLQEAIILSSREATTMVALLKEKMLLVSARS
jgi:hypothetical protein